MMSSMLLQYIHMALSKEEIKKRSIRLTNLERLYIDQKIQNLKLKKENRLLKTRVMELEKENKELKESILDIKYQLTQMKEIVFGKKKQIDRIIEEEEKKEKKDRDKGSYNRPVPKDNEITKVIYHKLKKETKNRTRIKEFYIEDIPLDNKVLITKHIVIQEWRDGKWTGDIPLPSKKVILGDNVRMLVTTLSVEQRLSYSQIQNLLKSLFNLHISQGEIVNILSKEAQLLTLTYQNTLEKIREERYHHMDETSWRINKENNFAWSMTGESGQSAYLLGVSRGRGNAIYLKGNSKGALISDDYNAYKNLNTNHQLCFAHLIRKWRDKEYFKVKDIFKYIKQNVSNINCKQIAIKKLCSLSKHNIIDPPPLIRYKETLKKNISKYVTAFDFPFLPLTNNIAEQSLRHLVIKRKISLGSNTHRGADSLAILLTVLKNLLKTNPNNFFEAYGRLRV